MLDLYDTLLRGRDLATSALRVVKNNAGHFVPKVASAPVGEAPNPLFRYLDTNGDGTGSKSHIGDYSVTPRTTFIQPPSDEVYRIAWLHLFLEGSGPLVIEKYDSLAALTNGLTIQATLDGIVVDITDGQPIHTNADLYRMAYDTATDDTGGANHAILSKINFLSLGAPLRLDGNRGDKLEIILNDNFTGMLEHAFIVKGVIEEL